MATTPIQLRNLLAPVAPRLLNAPPQYDYRYQDEHSNVLRLYFNQLDTAFAGLLSGQGGRFLKPPYAAIQRTTDQIFTANTATEVTFDQNDFLNGCLNDGTNGITVDYAGIYNYQFSAQFANTDSQIHAAWIWLSVNGVDVPGTGSRWDITAKHGASDGYVIAAANFYVSLNAGDYVSLMAAVSQAYVPATTTGIYMEAYGAQTTPFARPSIPSVVGTLTFVSGLPA